MTDKALEPWMLRADWRDDRRPWLLVDLAAWPPDLPIAPLPPVPVIGVGDCAHPQAATLDIRLEPGFTLDGLAAKIARAPEASAVLTQLLRATESVEVQAALTAESFAYAMLQAGREHAGWREGRKRRAAAAPGAVRVTRAGDVLEVTLDRPWALNAIDRTMRDGLYEAFSLTELDATIRKVRLTGAGRAFSMGADLEEFGTTTDPVEAHLLRARTLPARPMARRASLYEAHIHGGCVGSGLELAAFAGRVTAAPDAWFQLPETGMGILPGFGGAVSIPRRVGRQRAALLMLSGKRISARTALDFGLVDALVEDPAVDQGRADEVGR